MRYQNEKTKEIRFPLGGIGCGNISLAGNGRLTDWEIYNHPDKGRHNGYTHFAIKAERAGELVDARVLHGDYQESLSGSYNVRERLRKQHTGYGTGPAVEALAGMPHFSRTVFEGEFPCATLQFSDPHFPADVQLLAFNPFIPGNEDDSSLPVAWFEWDVINTADEALDFTLCCSLHNDLADADTVNRYCAGRHYPTLQFGQQRVDLSHPCFGEMALSTDATDVSWQEHWYRGSWFDSVSVFWHDFCRAPRLENRRYDRPAAFQDTSSLAAHFHLAAGESRRVCFLLSWYMPISYNYWRRWYDKATHELMRYEDWQGQPGWLNYYAVKFASASHVLDYVEHNAGRLKAQTLAFQQALHHSTLPAVVKEAVSANLAVLHAPTCLRLEDGSFYGWEGTLDDLGCCEGSCIHVWNYALALPWLFPRLSRSMRDLNQQYNLRESGSLRFRLALPLGSAPFDFRACVDGQFGEVINIYRDWLLCGDKNWLWQKWPAVCAMIRFAWDENNEDRWDPLRQGLITGRQHHTLDMELFGPNPWLSGLYLAALAAGVQIATVLGQDKDAALWQSVLDNGRSQLSTLFNGEYYQQRIDLTDREILASYWQPAEITWNNDHGDVYDFYWDNESQQLKYQLGDGCHIDQLMGQWLAELCLLDDIFPPQEVVSALRAIEKYNFRRMRDHVNPCRIFALNDEQGVAICAWPTEAPRIPVPYAQETMTGFEYQTAAHMIAQGRVQAGLDIVSSIRARYDGYKRNPWNEFECGSHYARSLASFGLLLAWSGLRYSAPQRFLTLNPVEPGEQQLFWTTGSAWVTADLCAQDVTLRVLYGELALQQLKVPVARPPVSCALNSLVLSHRYSDVDGITLDAIAMLAEGDVLHILC
ncbi:GH116 family glycosyl-hydrolase [Enterobacter cancerogenus]|uniref:GH116 family glycosyl-hydrolase n=1 Tax=Enterobacter cancerogenus TaxID=69218 RepID=UPI001299C247|nr:GH116 family glycosyl-hydrolase [Enterobacter cancerogenus]QGG08411.1 hypothetical protein GH771_06590 [Enterobacter cancerogenus]